MGAVPQVINADMWWYRLMYTKYNRYKGFSLTELMVAMALGLVIFSALISIMINYKSNTEMVTRNSELSDVGRYSLEVLYQDIFMAGFFGELTNQPIHSENLNIRLASGLSVSSDCTGDGENNESFPVTPSKYAFRYIYAETFDSSNYTIQCAVGAKEGSDVIQIKRVKAKPHANANSLDPSNFYLMANFNEGVFFYGADTTPADLESAQVWQYQHNIYFVENVDRAGHSIPVLKRAYLTVSSSTGKGMISEEPITEGVEKLRFLFGYDENDDGVVDSFYPSDINYRHHWEQQGVELKAVKVFILVRAVQPEAGYTNQKTYYMGDQAYTVNDSYRRQLFSKTIYLHNSGLRSHQEG